MLILTRRPYEKIMIGDEIIVQITGIDEKQVRIGIDAPKEIPIHREEIYCRIQTQAGNTDKQDETEAAG